MSKSTIVSAAGAFLGVVASPYVLQMFNVGQSAGLGMDDVISALVIVVAIMLVHAIF